MKDTIVIFQPTDPYTLPETPKRCPECGSDNVFDAEVEREWYGVCRNCWFKGLLDKFYKHGQT